MRTCETRSGTSGWVPKMNEPADAIRSGQRKATTWSGRSTDVRSGQPGQPTCALVEPTARQPCFVFGKCEPFWTVARNQVPNVFGAVSVIEIVAFARSFAFLTFLEPFTLRPKYLVSDTVPAFLAVTFRLLNGQPLPLHFTVTAAPFGTLLTASLNTVV